jgi:hypothetical protein
LITDYENLVDAKATYSFDTFGFAISFRTKHDHTSSDYDTYNKRATLVGNIVSSLSFSIREAMYALTFIPANLSSVISVSGSTNWVSTYSPTYEEIASDTLKPANKYKAVVYAEVALTAGLLINHEEYIDDRLTSTWQNKKINQYSYELDPWKTYTDTLTKIKFNGDSIIKTLTSDEYAMFDTSVYVNGQKINSYNIDDTDYVVTLTSEPSIGDTVAIFMTPKNVDHDKLEVYANLDTDKDSAINNVLYTYDYDFTTVKYANADGSMSKKYYFWVTGNKQLAHDMTISEINQKLAHYSQPYFMLNEVTGAVDKLPVRYKSIALIGVKSVANKRDTYKITLNNDKNIKKYEDDLMKKNIHTEWKLIKKSMLTKIPSTLWTQFVNAFVGENTAGETIPSAIRERYDQKHGTSVKYGFADGQIMMDRKLARSAFLKYYNEIAEDKYSGSLAIDSFDYDDFIENIDDSAITRTYLSAIYNNMKVQDLNSIFFSIIEIALAGSNLHTDIMKTSMISVVSNKQLKVLS